MPEGEIAPDDPRTPDVRALLEHHRAFALAQSPPEDVHALDPDGLGDSEISFFSFRHHGELLAIGALRALTADHVEIKAMHTAEAARGRGIGRAMVDHLLEVARTRGFRQVSLETGTMAAFAPARALYARMGFESCAPFGSYRPSPHSLCMTRWLGGGDPAEGAPTVR